MLYVTDSQIVDLDISAQNKINWVDDCLRHKYEYDLPAKISIKKQNGNIFYNTMPAILEPLNIAGVKCVNRYPSRNPSIESQMIVYDYSTGEMKAFLDANEITASRTAAVAVHSAKQFANDDFTTVSMLGLGVIMYHTADIFFEEYKNKKMCVKILKYKDSAERFIEKYSKYKNLHFEICNDYVDLFSNSDLIFSAVSYTENDFCSEKIFKKGCTIIPIHTRGFMCCDLSFDKVFGDDTAHLHEFKYFSKFKYFAEVSEVLLNKKEGRTSSDERIIVYNIGLAIHDLYYANKIISILK